MESVDLSRRSLLILALATEGLLGVAAVALGYFLGIPFWESWRWDAPALLWGVILTLPMLAFFFLCVRLPIGPLRPIKQFAERVVKPLFRRCTLLELALIAAVAGLGEELLFRGVLQPYLIDRLELAPWLGIVLTSLVFGLLHPITPGYVVLAAILGSYLGWWTVASGNVVEAVVAHGLYDFLALWFLVRGK